MTAILVIVFLTGLNGFFALSEIAVISCKPSRIQVLIDQGERRARSVMGLMKEPEAFLSAIQVGITLIGVFSGAYGGLTFSLPVQHFLESFAVLAPYAPQIAPVLVVGAITYFTIVFGELVPKAIALNNPEKIAILAAPMLVWFTRLTYPLVKILSLSTHLILRLFRLPADVRGRLSSDELRAMIRTANSQGILDSHEFFAHDNLLRLGDQVARTLMTDRGQVEWIDSTQPLDKILEKVKASPRTTYPVCRGQLDQIQGTLTVRDLLQGACLADFRLEQVVRPAVVIPENLPAFSILQQFKAHKQYIALVVDEHGQFEGLITLRDLVEAIMGDLPDEEENAEPEISQRKDGTWLVGGRVLIRELNAYFGRELMNEKASGYSTVAGYFLSKLERIPREGSLFVDRLFEGEVMDMDGHRIDKVLIKIRPDVD